MLLLDFQSHAFLIGMSVKAFLIFLLFVFISNLFALLEMLKFSAE